MWRRILPAYTRINLWHIHRATFAKVAAKPVSKSKANQPIKTSAKKKKNAQLSTLDAVVGKHQPELEQIEALLEKQLTHSSSEAAEIPDPRTPEQLALDQLYAKQYSRVLSAAHRIRDRANYLFLRSRWLAINALPQRLKTDALKEDTTPWPTGFQPIPWTAQEYIETFKKQKNNNNKANEKKTQTQSEQTSAATESK